MRVRLSRGLCLLSTHNLLSLTMVPSNVCRCKLQEGLS